MAEIPDLSEASMSGESLGLIGDLRARAMRPTLFKTIKWWIRVWVRYGSALLRSVFEVFLGKDFIPTDDRLDYLQHLSDSVAPRSDAVGWVDIVQRCLARMDDVRTFCSRSVLRDFCATTLAEHDYIGLVWRLDFAYPDRFHVTQQMWDDELEWLIDEWVSIGDANYGNCGLWFLKEPTDTETNQSLTSAGFLEVLCHEDPSSQEFYQPHGDAYLRLLYSNPDLTQSPNDQLRAFAGADESMIIEDHQVEVWVDLRTGLLVKGCAEIRGTTKDGSHADSESPERVHLCFEQMFACFDEKIIVEPPPWLNVIDGIVVGRSIPALHHHV